MPGHPLIDAFLQHLQDRPAEAPAFREAPPHWQGARWHFSCCRPWTAVADAELHLGTWTPPARQCEVCHEWVRGTFLSDPPPV